MPALRTYPSFSAAKLLEVVSTVNQGQTYIIILSYTFFFAVITLNTSAGLWTHNPQIHSQIEWVEKKGWNNS